MLVAADHEVRTRTPPAVLVEMPLSLDSLHGCATFVARRRGCRDELRSCHSVRPRSTRIVLDENPSMICRKFRHVALLAKWSVRPCFTGAAYGGGPMQEAA